MIICSVLVVEFAAAIILFRKPIRVLPPPSETLVFSHSERLVDVPDSRGKGSSLWFFFNGDGKTYAFEGQNIDRRSRYVATTSTVFMDGKQTPVDFYRVFSKFEWLAGRIALMFFLAIAVLAAWGWLVTKKLPLRPSGT